MAARPLNLQVAAVKQYDREPTGIKMSPDQKYLATYRSATITIYDMKDPDTALTFLKVPSGVVQDLAFSPDKKLLAAATDESQAILWSFPEGERLAILEDKANKAGFFKNLLSENSYNQVVFSPDGKYLSSISNSSQPLIWNLGDLSLHKKLHEPAADFQSKRIDFSPDGQMLVVGHNHKVALYHVETAIKIKDFKATPQSLIFHHNRKQFAIGVRDKILLFDPNQEGAALQTGRGKKTNVISKIMFSYDGRHLLAAGKSIGSKIGTDILLAWSLANGEVLKYTNLDSIAANCSGIKNPLYKTFLPACDHVALVLKNAPCIILLRF